MTITHLLQLPNDILSVVIAASDSRKCWALVCRRIAALVRKTSPHVKFPADITDAQLSAFFNRFTDYRMKNLILNRWSFARVLDLFNRSEITQVESVAIAWFDGDLNTTFEQLTALKKLRIEFSSFRDLRIPPNLISLSLSFCREMQHLNLTTSLQHLDIQECRSLTHISPLNHLQFLHKRDCPASFRGFRGKKYGADSFLVEDLAKRILASGGRPWVRNQFGETPLHLLCKRGGSVALAALLLQAAPVLMQLDYNGQGTPLDVAIKNGHEALAIFILRQGGQHNRYYEDLAIAAARGQMDLMKLLLEHLREGDDIDIRSPLNRAVRRGHLAMARLLLAHGADPTIIDVGGPSLDIARRKKDRGLERLLLEHMSLKARPLVPRPLPRVPLALHVVVVIIAIVFKKILSS